MQGENPLRAIFHQPSCYSGLDIGNYSVKFVTIKKAPLRKKSLLSFSAVTLAKNASGQNIQDAIVQASQGMPPESKKIKLSISGPNIIARYILLPAMKESDLAKALEFELEKYIPYKKEEAIINYYILTRLPNNQMVVLFVAAERKVVQERIDLVKGAGLEPQLITIDALALCEIFKALVPKYKGVAVILDIGYRLTKLVVLENNIPFFSRDIEIGEYDIIQMIADRMNISYVTAKEQACGADEHKVKELAEAAKTELHTLLNEISLSFEYCERNLEKKVQQIFLCGGGSRIKILSGFLEGIPDVKISFLDLAQGFSVVSAASSQEIHDSASFLCVGAGLALS